MSHEHHNHNHNHDHNCPHHHHHGHDIEVEELAINELDAGSKSLANALHISFTVPHVHYDSLRNMLNSIMINQQEIEYALVVRVNFQLTEGNVSGYMVIVMGVQSLTALLQAMRAVGYIE